MSKRKSFKATPKFFEAMDHLLAHDDCTPDTHRFISGMVETCQRTGFVSERQAECAGATYKRVVNGGRYIKHDWWS